MDPSQYNLQICHRAMDYPLDTCTRSAMPLQIAWVRQLPAGMWRRPPQPSTMSAVTLTTFTPLPQHGKTTPCHTPDRPAVQTRCCGNQPLFCTPNLSQWRLGHQGSSPLMPSQERHQMPSGIKCSTILSRSSGTL